MSSKAKQDVEFCGFKVISVKFDKNSKYPQHLFMKEHKVRQTSDNKPHDRTIFVLNVPPYCTRDGLINLFSECGTVEKVYLTDKPGSEEEDKQDPTIQDDKLFPKGKALVGYKVAYVVFKEEGGAKTCLTRNWGIKPRVLSSEKRPIPVGFKKWCLDYNVRIQDEQSVKSASCSYMENYDRKQDEDLKNELVTANLPDQDGWIKVTRTSGNQGGSRYSQDVQEEVEGKVEKWKKQVEFKDFYAASIKANKIKEILDMREKLQRDKQRMEIMKRERKFKPY